MTPHRHPRPTEALRARCAEDWEHAVRHPFCDALAEGSLPLARMRWYLVQDHKFVEAFLRLLARMVSEAPSLEQAVPGARFLGLIAGPENTYFLRSFEALGVTEADRAAPPAAPTAGFIALMEEARASGELGRMLAVLVVAEWSYLSWGERLAPPRADLPFWFAEWIELHSGEGFAGVVAYLRALLDVEWERLDAPGRAEVERIFREAVRLERAFFDAAWAAD